MEGVASLPSSSTAAYLSWEEVNVSSDKGRREVHYYLKRRDGVSDLAVIGKEKSLCHMSYHFAIKNRSLFFASTSFYKLKSRREVVYWLNSVVSDSSSREPCCSVGGFCNDKDVKNMDFGAPKDLKSWKLGPYTKEFLWLGSSWTCRKKRKHYQSFCRNGVIISIHDFVYVLAEEDKRLVAYLEDLYEDSRGNKMVVVRWFHNIDEVDGLATVLSPVHFKKFLNEATHTRLDPFVCCKQFENDDVKPFDVTQVKGYWKQDILRYMYSLSPLNDCVSRQQRTGDQKTDWNVDDGVRIMPRKRYCQSKDDDVYTHYSGSRESMDASCADVQDFQSSKNGTESFSSSGGRSRFLFTDEAKQYSSQHLKVGSQVEVLAQDSGMRGYWFRARIIKKRKDKEWILASRVAVPHQLGCASSIDVGSVVDVWWHDGWWEGIVVEKDLEDKFHVYFPGEKRESVFDSGNVRQSQEWLGNRWINITERHDLVSSILWDRKKDASKSYDCNLVKTTICDGGQCGNDGAKDVGLVPDLSKDDLLSQLKWKTSRKRKCGTATCVQKLNYSRNLIKSTAGLRCSSSSSKLKHLKRWGCSISSSARTGGSVYITDNEAMVLHGQAKKEVTRIELNKPKSLLLPGTSLASLESLSMPLVHEVVLSADIGCAECQRRIADIISRMNEPDSVVVDVLEKKVTLTCRYPGIVKLPSRQVPVIYRNPVSTMAMIKRIFRSSRR
ncbi:hypothetical protein CRYUN_Cryun06bG0176400 [Craigia yunnanensis]